MFDVPEDGFDFGGAPAAHLYALLKNQVLAGLFAKFQQSKTNPDVAVAFGPGALRPQGAVLAVQGFVVTGLDGIAVLTFSFPV